MRTESRGIRGNGSGKYLSHSFRRTRMEPSISCTRGCCVRVAQERVEGDGGRIGRRAMFLLCLANVMRGRGSIARAGPGGPARKGDEGGELVPVGCVSRVCVAFRKGGHCMFRRVVLFLVGDDKPLPRLHHHTTHNTPLPCTTTGFCSSCLPSLLRPPRAGTSKAKGHQRLLPPFRLPPHPSPPSFLYI